MAPRASKIDTSSTLVAYRINGKPYLEEGYAAKSDWQKDFDSAIDNLQSDLDSIQDLKDYLSDEKRAKIDKIKPTKIKYIKEAEKYTAQIDVMRQEALAAKEKKLQQQKEKELQETQQQAISVGNSSGLTASSGVNYFNGRKETYYSSQVLYHYRTPEWTVDAEGFYRTSEGYFVVAASDMPQGTVFDGSKGLCQVLDSGCAAGTTDYYVNW